MTSGDEFNGWVNRESWAASLHLSNDEGLYGLCLEVAGRALVDAAEWHDGWVTPHPDESRSDALRRIASVRAGEALAEQFNEWAQDVKDAACHTGEMHRVSELVVMMLDEVGSRWRVDWRAVAAPFVDEAAEVDQ